MNCISYGEIIAWSIILFIAWIGTITICLLNQKEILERLNQYNKGEGE